MREFTCAAFATLFQVLFESRLNRLQKPARYIITFILVWVALSGINKLYGQEIDYDEEICFLLDIGNLDCLRNDQRRELIIKALEHRKEAVLCFKQVQYIGDSIGLLTDKTPKELVMAAIAGLCTQPYGWSSVVNTLIVFAFEHSWDLAIRWQELQTNLNKGKHHVEMFEFYKSILDGNG